ncbi:MAG: N-acetylmuramoyl-L-alanine amidase [Verrucomicrobiales bacterium]|nr:N-acetylmuramoyl-L-alanine amidase [Verrucomicrobiales bacterium]
MSAHAAPFRMVFALLAGLAAGAILIPGAQAQRFNKVIIDPGHGGLDGGSKWYGVTEKNLTLDLAKRIKKILDDKGIPTVLTRETDVYVELVERAEMANSSKDTLFVSVHFNAHRDRSVTGIETFYYPGSEQGRVLGSYIQSELSRRIATRNRGVKPNRLKVLEATKGTAVLVECGFISNRWEAQRSASAWFRQILAEEIAQGIMRYR